MLGRQRRSEDSIFSLVFHYDCFALNGEYAISDEWGILHIPESLQKEIGIPLVKEDLANLH